MIYRNITLRLTEALSDSPVVLLNGARQTGKSTLTQWIASEIHSARYITLDDAGILAAIRHDPEGFISGLSEGNVVLDEVQRAPELFLAIKAAVDRNRRPGRFVLTGSANVMLLPRLSESLAGRMEIITLWPFSQGEKESIKEGFVDAIFEDTVFSQLKIKEGRDSIIQKIITGGYPEALYRKTAARQKAWFSSYITTILQRDVRDLANIEGLTIMPRLLSLLSARTASLVNFAEISRSIGLPQSTLKRYMTLLETTFLVQTLPAWFTNLSKRIVKAPKLILNDTGLIAHLIGLNEERMKTDAGIFGQLLENFVVMELRKQISWSRAQPQIFHYRTQTGREVDIILENADGKVVGIEVKASSTITGREFNGLRTLSEAIGKRFQRGIVLYTGPENIPFGPNLNALPVSYLWRYGIEKQKRK
jgi:predicted AAA+ superfamily ATPase